MDTVLFSPQIESINVNKYLHVFYLSVEFKTTLYTYNSFLFFFDNSVELVTFKRDHVYNYKFYKRLKKLNHLFRIDFFFKIENSLS